jgi:hypothetical protein
MARFTNLSAVGQVLADVLSDRLGISDVRVGPPLDTPTGTGEAVRITLAWITPQPAHRNDPWVPNPDGTTSPPPLTLSGAYLITSYGTTDDDNATQAHNLLGQALQFFHSFPELPLPFALGGGATTGGEGPLGVVHMPTGAELMEKVLSPLQIRHRPWALLDVAPIQLASLHAVSAEQPIVRPGGIHLGEIEATAPPAIRRIVPARIGPGGRIRIEADSVGAPSAVRIGDVTFSPADFTVPVAGGPILLTLPTAGANAIAPGRYTVTLRTGNLISDPAGLTVLPSAIPSVEAPADLTHPLTDDLVLTGRALAATQAVVFWPDEGVTSPADVVTLSGAGVTAAAASVTVSAARLQTAGLRPTGYRISARVSDHVFTPYVLMEFVP